MQSIQEKNLKKISASILGCGWLGLALAEHLVSKHFTVYGSTTTESKLRQLKQKNIQPELINLNPNLPSHISKAFLNSELLIICFPPRIRTNGEEFYLNQVKSIAEELEIFEAKKIIFTSSTSIYPSLNKEVTEHDGAINHVFYKAEKILSDKAKVLGKDINILRLSGLMGYGRIPCKYFSGKKGLENGDTPVNYIHRDDVVRIMGFLVLGNVWNETLNITAPMHPIRKEVMEKCTAKTIYEMPTYVNPKEKVPYKIIGSSKFERLVDYSFKYPNPLTFPFE